MRTRVKICGLRTAGEAHSAVELGADAIGLNFYAPSVRAVEPDEAAPIAANLPAFVTCVGLFLDAAKDDVARVLGRVQLDLLQFHGSEPADYCESFGLPYIKSVPLSGHARLAEFAARHPRARALLVDSNAEGAPGGSGKVFDWSQPLSCAKPLLLAGGLHAGNVAEAIAALAPYAVDVSSGVERAPGVKSATRMREFMQAVRQADQRQQ